MSFTDRPFLALERSDGEPLTLQERKQMLDRIGEALSAKLVKTATIERYTLPFYDGVTLVNIQNPGDSARLCYLEWGEKIYRLNGTSPPIHEVNNKAGVKITEDNVKSYLAYFCYFVRGEEGPFLIIDRPSHSMVPNLPEIAQLVEDGFRPIEYWGQSPEGHFRTSCLVYYSNALFVSNFEVEPTGMLRMVDDQPIAADLPRKILSPLTLN